ncbi:TonB-dependent receptor [Brevundimonas sp.]|uniref:TonB-dependent receptor n=1 Tax=Brevundimonas sp. TaxID=1871086 RepID=UPI002CEF694E|nr:TonB-dependent receptor [Brevundimonas sp.]HWQ85383.1 TonB-dependent receptor [Brevundimonas sp.]
MSRFSLLSGSALAACVLAVSTTACAQTAREFDIPPGSLRDGLNLFATQSDQQILFSGDLVAGLRTEGLRGRFAPSAALDRLLAGSGLAWSETRPGVIFLRRVGAGEVAETVTQLDEVVVTGTLLKSSGDLASPVITLDRDALDRRGFATVAEALTDLPQNYAGSATPVVQLAGSDRGGSNSVYATGVNLRGLGPASTLVLVNGRRLAGTGFRGEFGDVSALPSAAVERVDVLLDGASALYGADAVAGVVNVIMRRSFEGQESRVRVAAAEGGAEDVMASHLAGRTWSSGAGYLSYEYQTTHALSSRDRPYTADGDLRPFGGTDHRGLFSSPGNILAFDPAAGAFVARYAIRPNATGTAQTPADFVAGSANLQSSMLGADLVPALERHSVYGRLRQSFGDRFEAAADLRYSRRTHEVAGVANSGVFTVTQANPHFVSPTGAASHTIGYSFLGDLGPTRQEGRSESVGATIGGSYAFDAGWSLDGYLAFAQERGLAGVYNRVNSRLLNEALGTIADDPTTSFRASVDGYANLFGDGGANSRAVLDFISSGYSEARDRSRASSVNLLAQGPLLTLPAGDLQFAIGAQVRRETFDTEVTAFLSTAAPRFSPSPQRERSISAVFAEARIPLIGPDNARPGIRGLEVSLAGRYEEYDDFGSTANPKIGVVWSPVDDLGVRVSWGTSFRAASLPQIHDAAGAFGTFLKRADGSDALALFLVGGNADLTPETAETLALGFDYRPRGRLNLSLNYFDTRFTDRIAQPVAENLLGVLSDAALAPFVTVVNPGTSAEDRALVESYSDLPGFSPFFPIESYRAVVDARWVNTGDVRVRGLDLSGTYPLHLGENLVTFDASASYILDYETRPTPAAAVQQVAGLIGYPVRLRARAGAEWSRGAFGLGLHANHVDDYEDRVGNRIASWTTVDGQVSWTPSSARLDGLRLSLTIQNLFDEDPPFYDAPTGYGFDPGQGGLLGRVVALQLTRRW